MKHSRPQFIIAQLLLMLLMAAAPLLATEVEGTRLWRAPDHTRLVLDLSAAVDYQTFVLSKPSRFVIDIADTTYRRSVAAQLRALDLTNAPIAKIRSAKRNQSDLRVVLELTKSVQAKVLSLIHI